MPFLKKLCAVAALVLLWTPAEGASLQLPHILGLVQFTHPGITTETTTFGTITQSDPIWGDAGLTLAGEPSPSITASAASPVHPSAQTVARGVGSIEYVFEILGPAGGVPVLVSVAGSVQGEASPGASFALESSWSLTTPGSLLASDSILTGQQTGSFGDSFGKTYSLVLQTNQLYTVSMRADASVGFHDLTSATAFAFIDPLFAFGSGVDPLAYTFNLSPGIGNTPPPTDPPAAVPEPTTGLLLLGGLAASCYRRRRAASR